MRTVWFISAIALGSFTAGSWLGENAWKPKVELLRQANEACIDEKDRGLSEWAALVEAKNRFEEEKLDELAECKRELQLPCRPENCLQVVP